MQRRLTRISLLQAKPAHKRGYRTAVSLHCHTHYSKEHLDFVPRYASQIPIVSSFFSRETDRYYRLSGKTMDFAEWYWTPPVTVQSVIESETQRIERKLGLKPLISLTDHNEIGTANAFQRQGRRPETPISLEWTVPMDGGSLHLGIHNLPTALSGEIARALSIYSRQPREGRFIELLAWLNEYPETLVVLNHPLSDMMGVGAGYHKGLVVGFLNRYGKRIHALEINGYRPWRENRATINLAERYGLPVVSGGDRHGCAPNAVLNLTNGRVFSEFVYEVRKDRISEVLVMPDYWKDLVMRKIESLADFFRYYADRPHGQRRWTDRVFIQLEDGVVKPLSNYWDHTVPMWVKSVMWLVGLVESSYVQPALGMVLARKVKVPLWERIRTMPSN